MVTPFLGSTTKERVHLGRPFSCHRKLFVQYLTKRGVVVRGGSEGGTNIIIIRQKSCRKEGKVQRKQLTSPGRMRTSPVRVVSRVVWQRLKPFVLHSLAEEVQQAHLAEEDKQAHLHCTGTNKPAPKDGQAREERRL